MLLFCSDVVGPFAVFFVNIERFDGEMAMERVVVVHSVGVR